MYVNFASIHTSILLLLNMAGKQSKSLKKFAKRKLTDVISKRRRIRPVVKEMRTKQDKKVERAKAKQEDEEKKHMQQLDELKEEDQEFADFLKMEDPGLLEFGDDGLGAEETFSDDDLNELHKDEEHIDELTTKWSPARIAEIISNSLGVSLDETPTGTVKTPTQTSLRRASQAFHQIVLLLSSESVTDAADVVSLVKALKFTAENFCQACNQVLGRTNSGGLPKSYSNYPSLAPAIRSFITNCAAIVSSDAFDTDIASTVVHCLGDTGVEYVGIFPKPMKKLLRAALKLSTHLTSSFTRESARLFLHSCARRLGASLRESIFKGMFLAVVAVAPSYAEDTAPAIADMIEGLSVAYGIDLGMAYATLFVYVRQLALYLRAALLHAGDTAPLHRLHSWQLVISTRTIGTAVSDYPGEKELWPLAYPLVQICLGTLDVFTSSRTFPIHFHLFELLQSLSSRCNVHVPLAPYFLRMLQSAALNTQLSRSSKNSEAVATDEVCAKRLKYTIRLNKQELKSRSIQQALLHELLYCITQHTALHAFSIGFPESFAVLHVSLKRICKKTSNPILSQMFSNYLKKVQTTEDLLIQRRERASFGPCDEEAVALWEAKFKEECVDLPLMQYASSMSTDRVQNNGDTIANYSHVKQASNANNKRKREKNGKKGVKGG